LRIDIRRLKAGSGSINEHKISNHGKKTSCGNLGEKFEAKKDELRRKL